MPYSSENLKSVSDAFKAKKLRAEEEAMSRRAELYAKLPKVAEIDRALSETGLKIFAESLKGKCGLDERIENLRIETNELRDARRVLLECAGFASDYDEPRYECKNCMDTGVGRDGKSCACFKRALCAAGFESSGMAKLISKQSFDNFSLDYYTSNDRDIMEKNLAKIKNFASSFVSGGGRSSRNMLFMGTTGLGKTHLSSAVAKTVIENGGDVVYESAQNIFSDFEHERFFRTYGDRAPSKTDKYFDCDLLIMDDLGTEVSNQFTVSCLYNLMNSRIVSEKSILISTNVGKEEMLSRYSDRILSRLFGEFEICVFCGKDIRSQKLRR